MIRRGDVVIVAFPFTSGTQAKVRPALIVQNDRDNSRLRKTILAMISGNLRRASEPTHLLIDPGTAEGASSGLHGPSLAVTVNLYTIDQADILQTIGHISDVLKLRLDACLKAALELS
jgi:mRNA interferase MazF